MVTKILKNVIIVLLTYNKNITKYIVLSLVGFEPTSARHNRT